ncbi:hypothetical protein AAZV13_02G190400 [Glycine max]|uniref:Uncharacterized protein n=1 Tax=Glycine max TaxID=3847 RepID=A0A368ULY1_SOYBN|nr:protein DAMAGED DNA-BINDING 2 isoform X2 [Glycine max]|eukprot:XP_006575405.1 protein DAMAGED DNA-BINDING 2 isoform X2 [Glycine max]
MAPVTPRTAFPKVLIERDSDSEQSSSEEEEEKLDEEEEEEEVGVSTANEKTEKLELGSDANRKGKAPITISLKKVCKVCKKPGHEAGFKGAAYIDCPMKPCFLCKMPGHTTLTCPHRVSTEHGVVPAPRRKACKPLEYVFERQLRPSLPSIKPKYVIPDQVNCAVIRYHSRRITCLEFHPTKNNILLSGDKKGQLGVWDFGKVYEKVVYGNIHSCLVNNMRFNPTNDCMVYSASSDGTISCTDLETGISSSPLNLNPDGWQGPNTWKMLNGLDINSEKGLVLVADSFGFLHMVDIRSNNRSGDAILIHKKGKVVGIHCNPIQPDIFLTCGNDHFDNRLRVWDSIFGNVDSPSREIVHSHDFNRHLTPFKAEWDPKDPSESLAVVGRYISENYNGAALHPIDFIDTSTGQLVAEVMDPNITTISPVNKLHPRDDILATGSSRSLFIWKPKEKSELVEEKDEQKIVVCGKAEKKRGKKNGNISDESDDEGFMSKSKKSKSKKTEWKLSRCTTKDNR